MSPGGVSPGAVNGELRTVFVGAVEGSQVALAALNAAGLSPAAVVTLDPAVAHRHSDHADLEPLAREAGAALIRTRNVNDAETLEAIAALRPDLVLVIGWSQICREAFLALPRLGSLGFHPSPLPRMRGRAVIPWTIICGETRSGSTLFALAPGTDTGDIVEQRLFDVAPDETARTLYEKHKGALADMLPDTVRRIAREGLRGRSQDEGEASVCAKRTPADGRIDWTRPAAEIERLVRAVGDPYPGAFAVQNAAEGERHFPVPLVRPVAAPRFIGFAGQVQGRTREGWTVLCGDGAALEVVSDERPAVHSRLD